MPTWLMVIVCIDRYPILPEFLQKIHVACPNCLVAELILVENCYCQRHYFIVLAHRALQD